MTLRTLLFLPFVCQIAQYLFWEKGIRLNFDDFRSMPPANTVFYGGVSNHIYIDCYLNNDVFEYDIFAYVNRDSSWLRTKDSVLLNHEQQHFDLAEIFARLIRRDFNKKLRKSDYEAKINDIYSGYIDRLWDYHIILDSSTRHGTISDSNLVWNKRIDSMLNSLEDYAEPSSKVILK